MIFQVVASTIRVSVPLVFASMGGLVSERAGVINIALEGLMLGGAFTGASVALTTGSVWLGVLGAVAGGVAMSIFYGICVIHLRANQIVAGTAVNLLAIGITPLLSRIFYGSTTSLPALPLEMRFQTAPIWTAGVLVLVVWAWLYHTPSGLRVRFAGENPEALDSAGVSVLRMRWIAVLLSGCFAGLGGASLSLFLSSTFSRQMTAGRGFMALAALIFGRWRPFPAALACILFGFAESMQIRLQGVILWGERPVPVQFIQVLPYIVTILVLAGFVGQSRAPRALGLPYEKH